MPQKSEKFNFSKNTNKNVDHKFKWQKEDAVYYFREQLVTSSTIFLRERLQQSVFFVKLNPKVLLTGKRQVLGTSLKSEDSQHVTSSMLAWTF